MLADPLIQPVDHDASNPEARGRIGHESAPIRVVIIEPERLVGEALAALLVSEPDIVVVGILDCAYGSGARTARMSPDIVIMDFRLDVSLAMDVAIEIRRAGCRAQVIVLTHDQSDTGLLAAIEADARAVIRESEAGADMILAVRRTADGLTSIPPGMVATMLRRRRFKDDPRHRLTRREREVLGLLAQGVANREIALTLGIRYVTVRTHLRNVGLKLAAHSKLEMVAKAYELELIARGQ